jgi:serine protease AprX
MRSKEPNCEERGGKMMEVLSKRARKEQRWKERAARSERHDYVVYLESESRRSQVARDPNLAGRAQPYHSDVRVISYTERDARSRSGWEDARFRRTIPYQVGAGVSAPTTKTGRTMDNVLMQIKAANVWEKYRGQGVTIVVIDTGVDGSLPEFRKKNRRVGVTIPGGNHWIDPVGHGTMAAAIACGTAGDGARYNGVAPDAELLPVRLPVDHRGSADDIWLPYIYGELLRLRKDHVLDGPVVVSHSLAIDGCEPTYGDHERDGVVVAARRCIDAGMVFVFAAGNNHLRCSNQPAADVPSTIWALSSYDPIISVGTVDWDGSNQVPGRDHASSSRGKGEWATSTSKPDVVAPTYGEVRYGTEYKDMDCWRTSGAAPQAAGLAALILSKNSSLSPGDVQAIITSSTTPLKGSRPCVGNGMINCEQAIARTP